MGHQTAQPMAKMRQATPADIDGIMRVEEDWPESQRASRDKMLTRLAKFPEGFWVMESGGEIVGTLTSCLLRYDPGVKGFKTWDQVTNNGYLHDIDRSTANALYMVSGSLKKEARGGTGYTLFIQPPIQLAETLGLDYVLTGAKIPGYDAYCRRHGDVDAGQYAFLKLHGCLVDPFLEMYRGMGFTVPDRDHIIKDFYPDPPSRDYGAIVVRKIRKR